MTNRLRRLVCQGMQSKQAESTRQGIREGPEQQHIGRARQQDALWQVSDKAHGIGCCRSERRLIATSLVGRMQPGLDQSDRDRNSFLIEARGVE